MNRPIHFEFQSSDPASSQAFFENVLGWGFTNWPGPEAYWSIETGEGDGINGGLLPSRDGAPRTVITMQVDDVDAATDKVTQGGGQVVVPKMAIKGVGYLAYCVDPTGVLFGLMNDDSEAA